MCAQVALLVSDLASVRAADNAHHVLLHLPAVQHGHIIIIIIIRERTQRRTEHVAQLEPDGAGRHADADADVDVRVVDARRRRRRQRHVGCDGERARAYDADDGDAQRLGHADGDGDGRGRLPARAGPLAREPPHVPARHTRTGACSPSSSCVWLSLYLFFDVLASLAP